MNKKIIIIILIFPVLLILVKVNKENPTNAVLPNKISSVGSKLAEDPNWFKRPINYQAPIPTKYINIKNSNYKNEEKIWEDSFVYFKKICLNEQITMINTKYKDILNDKEGLNSIIHLRSNDKTPLNKEISKKDTFNEEAIESNDEKFFNVESNIVFKETLPNNNQYRLNYGMDTVDRNLFDKNLDNYINKKVDFSLEKVDNKYHMKYQLPKKNLLREFLSNDGKIYKIIYDSKSPDYSWGNYLNLEKENEFFSQYYTLWREYRTNNMNKHFIVGKESILYDKINNELVKYTKTFFMGDCNKRQGRSDLCVEKQSWKSITGCSTNNIKEF